MPVNLKSWPFYSREVEGDVNGRLWDGDGDGQPDPVATTISDANGDVSFTGLTNGSYVIDVADANGVLGGLNGTTSEGVNGISDTVTVTGGGERALGNLVINEIMARRRGPRQP